MSKENLKNYFMTVKDLKMELGLSDVTQCKLRRRKENPLPFIRCGGSGKILYLRDDVLNWLKGYKSDK